MTSLKKFTLCFLHFNLLLNTINSIHLNADQVKEVLTWPMVNEAVEEAMKSIVDNAKAPISDQPQRSVTKCGSPKNVLLTMPAYVSNYELTSKGNATETKKKFQTLACKVVTSFRDNEKRDQPLPNILANILLFNTETGQLDCVMDATQITAWRTAAASIVATKYLYFQRFPPKEKPNAITLAIIGCGTQGKSHALGMSNTFNIKTIYLWNRTKAKAENLKKLLNEKYPHIDVFVAETPNAAVKEADVICVATYASNSLINYSMLNKTNIHINTVGAGDVHYGEVDQDIYDHARVYVDSWSNARAELGGLKANLVAEVGEVILTGNYPNQNGITIFQSMGMAVEDATVAQAVLEAYQAKH